jgi:hypothetical protein
MTVEHCVSDETECSTLIAVHIRLKLEGRRKHVMHAGTLCSRCLSRAPASAKVRYCRPCKAAHEATRRKRKKEAAI